MKTAETIHVLFADDQVESFIEVFRDELSKFNFRDKCYAFNFITESTLTKKKILKRLDGNPEITVVILDLYQNGTGKLVGVEILKDIPKDRVQVLIFSQAGVADNPKRVNECDAAGAYDYFGKAGISYEEMGLQILHAHQYAKACRKYWDLDLKKFPIEYGIYGRSDGTRKVIAQINQIAEHDASVLITGETGVGKELVARGIHEKSGRKQDTFFPQNIAAVADHLLQSELFGHEKGAFTGADKQRKGLFRQAGEISTGGTVFLDEIGDAPSEIQVALLRVVQERKVKPVGSDVEYPREGGKLDFRLISATNQELKTKIKENEFRLDLHYRIADIIIQVPPLRARRDDIGILTHQFFAIHRRIQMKSDLKDTLVDPQDLDLMKRYRWPGNVRELDTVVKRGVILEKLNGKTFRLAEYDRAEMQAALHPDSDAPASSDSTSSAADTSIPFIPFPQTMDEIEKQAIQLALEHTEGNKTQAAKLLEMSSSTFARRIDKYGITFSN